MKTKIFVSTMILAGLLFACGPSAEEKASVEKMKQDSISSLAVSSSAAVENNKDTTHRFIRTADLKFKVRSVIRSTYDIEDIIGRQGGYVSFTSLNSNIDRTTINSISADSSLETTYFTVSNTMTLRVPNTNLDSTLKEISHNIDYLDYRIIKAEDVALQIFSNKLAQGRAARSEERLVKAIDKNARKLHETTAAEETRAKRQEDADNARISNLSLNEQIRFSTVNITMYQRQSVKRELIANDKNIDEYTPGFRTQLLESLVYGWESLEYIIVLISKLWGILVLAIIVVLVYKIARKKLKKVE